MPCRQRQQCTVKVRGRGTYCDRRDDVHESVDRWVLRDEANCDDDRERTVQSWSTTASMDSNEYARVDGRGLGDDPQDGLHALTGTGAGRHAPRVPDDAYCDEHCGASILE
jgi:hypothetical protein